MKDRCPDQHDSIAAVQARELVEQLLLSGDVKDALAVESLIDAHPQLRAELAGELQKLECIDGIVSTTQRGSTADMQDLPKSARFKIPGYEITGRIGSGGQASVFCATQTSTGQTVAIKAIHGGALLSESARKRFDREIRILVDLDHPHIASVIDRGVTDEGTPFVAMRYVTGRDLDEWLTNRRADPGTPSNSRWLNELLDLFVRICRAVDAAHQKGIVHRDLKPSNVRVDARGEPHILDFGLAHVVQMDTSEHAPSATDHFVGSLPWASPEQMGAVEEPVDARSDVFSLGLILFEMLAERLPYQHSRNLKELLSCITTVGSLPPSAAIRQSTLGSGPRMPISSTLDAIVLKAIALRPADRYASAGMLAADLSAFLSGQPTLAVRRRWMTSQKLIASLALGAAFLFPVVWLTYRAMVPPVIRVSGVVWSDENGDGFRQSTEPGLAGVVVYEDINENARFDAEPGATSIADRFTVTGERGEFNKEVARRDVIIRCEAESHGETTFPRQAQVPTQHIFTFVGPRTVRLLKREPGKLLDFQLGQDYSWRVSKEDDASRVFENGNLLSIVEDENYSLDLHLVDNRQLVVGWVRDKRYLARLTMQDHGLQFFYLGSLPLERTITDIGDINGDGLYDLLVKSRQGVPSDEDDWYLQVCWGEIDGNFDFNAPLQLVAERQRGFAAALEDINGDGVLDLLFHRIRWGGYYTLALKVALGNGGGSFDMDRTKSLLQGPADHGLLMQHPVDIDGDGERDLLFLADDDTQDEGQSYVAMNLGQGRYELAKFVDFVPSNEAPGQDRSMVDRVALLDVDQDGHLDLLASNGFATGAPVLLYRRVDEAVASGSADNLTGVESKLSSHWLRTAWPKQWALLPVSEGAHRVSADTGERHVVRDFGFRPSNIE